MKVRYLIPILLLSVGCSEPSPRNMDDLVVQGDLYLDGEPMGPYSGDVIQINEDNQVVRRASLRNGRWHGEYQSFMVKVDGGGLAYPSKGRYDNGQKCGPWTERSLEAAYEVCDLEISNESDANRTLDCLISRGEDERVAYVPC